MGMPQVLATCGGDGCPVCRAPVRPRIHLGAYTLFACETCSCWCSDAGARNVPTGFDPADYFDNDGADRARWRSLLSNVAEQGEMPRKILDVGCGTGAFLEEAAHQVPSAELTGIELDPERAAFARRRNPEAHVRQGDALRVLSQMDGRFDLITLWDVFEHVCDPRALLQALATRLREGGTIFIQTIHEYSLVPTLGRLSYRLTGGRLRTAARRTHEAHHLVFFSRAGLGLLADAANLSITRRWYDRLARARMDGHPVVTAATAALLTAENAMGNGLFINLVLQS